MGVHEKKLLMKRPFTMLQESIALLKADKFAISSLYLAELVHCLGTG